MVAGVAKPRRGEAGGGLGGTPMSGAAAVSFPCSFGKSRVRKATRYATGPRAVTPGGPVPVFLRGAVQGPSRGINVTKRMSESPVVTGGFRCPRTSTMSGHAFTFACDLLDRRLVGQAGLSSSTLSLRRARHQLSDRLRAASARTVFWPDAGNDSAPTMRHKVSCILSDLGRNAWSLRANMRLWCPSTWSQTSASTALPVFQHAMVLARDELCDCREGRRRSRATKYPPVPPLSTCGSANLDRASFAER